MSPMGAAILATAGVYAYASLYGWALYLVRRDQREHLAFGNLCGALAVFAVGTAWTVEAVDPASGAMAQRAQTLGLMPAMAFFPHVLFDLMQERRPRLIAASYALCAAGWVLGLSGLFADPALPDASYDWSLGSPGRAVGAISPLCAIALVTSAGIGAFATFRFFTHARGRRDLRVAAIVIALGLAGGLVDIAARVLQLPHGYIATHAGLLPVLGLTYVLASRLSRVDVQLADRTVALLKSHDQLRTTQQELVRREQLAAVGELSAVIAHEVRNPLAIIKNAVAGLRRDTLAPADGETLLSILDEESDRLNRLVDDLLAYANPVTPELGSVDLRLVVAHAVELAASGNARTPGVEIELELDEVDAVEGDEALLRHALINIVDNALQAMPAGGTLTIRCRNLVADGRPSVAVDLVDTGEGMDTLVRTKARDPFFTTRQTGTGLGLAIVDRVARVHGGRVEIESRHGEGTRVSLIVPRERVSLPLPASFT
ncbi:MAG: hypothetical protein IT378_11285 [Sandaracinaceae bacterium]|nr:hypothetical protein [Sandaracinaceae bacterium]